MKVRVDDAERADLDRRAAAAGLSVPRFLVASAVAGGRPQVGSLSAADRVLLLTTRHQLAGMAANLNQVARWSNTEHQVAPGFDHLVGDIAALVAELTERLEAAQ